MNLETFIQQELNDEQRKAVIEHTCAPIILLKIFKPVILLKINLKELMKKQFLMLLSISTFSLTYAMEEQPPEQKTRKPRITRSRSVGSFFATRDTAITLRALQQRYGDLEIENQQKVELLTMAALVMQKRESELPSLVGCSFLFGAGSAALIGAVFYVAKNYH